MDDEGRSALGREPSQSHPDQSQEDQKGDRPPSPAGSASMSGPRPEFPRHSTETLAESQEVFGTGKPEFLPAGHWGRADRSAPAVPKGLLRSVI